MRFGFLRHAIGTNWRDLCTTLHIMRGQWWPCAQLRSGACTRFSSGQLTAGHQTRCLIFPSLLPEFPLLRSLRRSLALFLVLSFCSVIHSFQWRGFLGFVPSRVVLRFLNLASASHQVPRQVFVAAQRGLVAISIVRGDGVIEVQWKCLVRCKSY